MLPAPGPVQASSSHWFLWGGPPFARRVPVACRRGSDVPACRVGALPPPVHALRPISRFWRGVRRLSMGFFSLRCLPDAPQSLVLQTRAPPARPLGSWPWHDPGSVAALTRGGRG